MKLYLHANTDQVYSALTNNAITSFANTIENLQHKALSFMSDNFIFLSKTVLPDALRQWKTDDVYFPVTLELDFSGIDKVPGLAVTMVDGAPAVADGISNLKDASEDMIGAFVCGEIPFAFVSAIIFENEENQVRFRKPSPDLWFPEELYKLADADCNEAAISIDDIATLSQKAEECLSEEDKAKVAALVSKRNRFKGLCYFAIREIGDWQNDNIKSNFDAYLVKTLDGKKGEDGVFFKAVSEGRRKFQGIAIVGGHKDAQMPDWSYPCGVCRQVMEEFCNPEEFLVIVARSKDEYQVYKLGELLPYGFGPKNVKGEK